MTCDTPPNSTAFNNRAAHSGHIPGGVMAAMCDGRVIWLSDDIDFNNVYVSIFTRAGNEPAVDLR